MTVSPYANIVEAKDGLVVIKFEPKRGQRLPEDGFDFMEYVRRAQDYASIKKLLQLAKAYPALVANQPGTSWVMNTGASAIALAAATAKTIMYVNAGSTDQPIIDEICVGFDGTSSSAVVALVELVLGTKATNSTPGTGSTSGTFVQQRGWPTQAPASTGAINSTSEPTVLTAGKSFLVTPNAGLLVLQHPLGRETTGVASGTALSGNQLGVRVTAPAIVNVRGYLEVEE